AALATVRLEQLGQHLVRTVRHPRLLRRQPHPGAQLGAQLERPAIGITVQLQLRQPFREQPREHRRWWFGGLVGVQAYRHIELGSAIGFDVAQVVADIDPVWLRHELVSRSNLAVTAVAWAGMFSAVARRTTSSAKSASVSRS